MLAALMRGYWRRSQWEADLLASRIVHHLKLALGDGQPVAEPQPRAGPGNNDRVTADTFLRMMGLGVER